VNTAKDRLIDRLSRYMPLALAEQMVDAALSEHERNLMGDVSDQAEREMREYLEKQKQLREESKKEEK
jgi:hypothetical protein